MFTGVIEETGKILDLSRHDNIYRLSISASTAQVSVKPGDSISVNGACLTLVSAKKEVFIFDIMEETYNRAGFSYMLRGQTVNLERSMGVKSRFEGHFVLGHIDAVERIKGMSKGRSPHLDISINKRDEGRVVNKGSVAIDGISLTVGEVFDDAIRVYIIPYTMEHTNLRLKQPGDKVNVEFDIIGKYVTRNMAKREDGKPGVTQGYLKEKGFI
ncbi:MAG: riboflavin synthase [Candidatus Omnitrophota bacterium]